jgi:hypothetical protein
MKYQITIFLFITSAFLLFSCKRKPNLCEKRIKIEKIELIPTNRFTKGKKVEIKNDSLINFLINQICNSDEVSWSTGTRGEGEIVELIFTPSFNEEKIFVVYRGADNNDVRYREGTTYFKNDLLCQSVFKLVGLQDYLKEKDLHSLNQK